MQPLSKLEYSVIDVSLEVFMKNPSLLNFLDLKSIHVCLVCYYRHFLDLKIDQETIKAKLEPFIRVYLQLFLAWKQNLDKGDLETFLFGLGVISEFGKDVAAFNYLEKGNF